MQRNCHKFLNKLRYGDCLKNIDMLSFITPAWPCELGSVPLYFKCNRSIMATTLSAALKTVMPEFIGACRHVLQANNRLFVPVDSQV